MQQHWPSRLWIVRHGESAGNVARDAAMRAGAARIDTDARDVDVPLSALGEHQADAVGRWFNAWGGRAYGALRQLVLPVDQPCSGLRRS